MRTWFKTGYWKVDKKEGSTSISIEHAEIIDFLNEIVTRGMQFIKFLDYIHHGVREQGKNDLFYVFSFRSNHIAKAYYIKVINGSIFNGFVLCINFAHDATKAWTNRFHTRGPDSHDDAIANSQRR